MNDTASKEATTMKEDDSAAMGTGASSRATNIVEDVTANKNDTVGSDIKEEDSTTVNETEATEAVPKAAGSTVKNENSEESAAISSPTQGVNKDAAAVDPKEGTSAEQAGDSVQAVTEPSMDTQEPSKETKKRVRRVGRTPTRKIPKLEETIAPPLDVPVGDNNVAAAVDAATAAIGTVPEAVGAVAMESSSVIAVAPTPANQAVLSKHDEKWHAMFQKLMEFKERNKHTLVPQCYAEDPRLGRWVHYQRVEYWIFQQKGTAKITEERIARLNHIGFEWDPQKAQWEKMFAKLKEFKKEFSHCRVPKGYDKDWELANWVRNQRLEQANLSKEGKKSRMTPERFKLLDDLGFKWSSPTPARARRNRQVKKKGDGGNDQEPKVSSSNEAAPTSNSEDIVSTVVPTVDAKGESAVAAEEAITAATNVVGNLSSVEASTQEENQGSFQEAEEGKSAVEESKAGNAVPVENENPVVVV